MDAIRKLNRKGFALVYLALMMVVLIGLVSLAVDLGYVYVAKGQLQNAADAAALAGASALENYSSAFLRARQRAQQLASANSAAGESVAIDLNQSNEPAGDIVVGHWDGTSFSTTGFINAIKVTARRTSETGTGITSSNSPVSLFFGNLFGWEKMQASSQSIASRPLLPSVPLTICIDSSGTTYPNTFYFKYTDSPSPALDLALTEFSSSMSTSFNPKGDLVQYLTGEKDPPDVCGKFIASNNGHANQIFTKLETRYNTESSSTGYWDVVVPVVRSSTPGGTGCPPDSSSADPKIVAGYAKIRITGVSKNPTPSLAISTYEFAGCSAIHDFLGEKASLVR